MTPELLSPNYSRFVPAPSGCVRRSPVSEPQRHHSLEGTINLVAPRSVRPHRPRLNQPPLSPPLCSPATSRDFVDWRFFVRLPSPRADRVVMQASENLHINGRSITQMRHPEADARGMLRVRWLKPPQFAQAVALP